MLQRKLSSAARESLLAVLVVAGFLFPSSPALAQAPDPMKVLKGMQIAPVPLNLQGKDSNLVGYGSYLVNAVSACNGCHSAGPQTAYAPGGNPFFGLIPKPNPATYLGGGRDFGAFPDPAGPFPHIVSRNLTPDGTGLPIGGDTFEKFLQTIRTGVDPDLVHPGCAGPPNGKCLPPPFKGELLQIMPWPEFREMTDDDLRAIYTYLSAIPCVGGGPADPPNRCVAAPKTTAVAGPKNSAVVSREIQLDGSKSSSADGKALKYEWTIPQGSPSAAIYGGNTATPSVQFSQGGTLYSFQLTVTDSKGVSSTDVTTVNYQGY